VFITSKSS